MASVEIETYEEDIAPDQVDEKTWSEVIHPETAPTEQGLPQTNTGTAVGSDTTTQAVLDLKSSNFKYGITGWRLGANGIIDAVGARLASSAQVGDGSNGIVVDQDGIRGYNTTLGQVFNLPTDGSAPTFSNGTISESVFEINTNAVLRTSETVEDGSADSAGVLINNTGVYGLGANQTVADANVRIKNEGTLYVGNTTNYLSWDGTYLRLKGAFDVGTNAVINNASYAVSALPSAPSTAGFNNPSATAAY